MFLEEPPPKLPSGTDFFNKDINSDIALVLPTYDTKRRHTKRQCPYPRNVPADKRNFLWLFLLLLITEILLFSIMLKSEHSKMEQLKREKSGGVNAADVNRKHDIPHPVNDQEPAVKILKRTVLS